VSEWIEAVRDGRVLRIRLNRPEMRNALTREMCGEIAAAFREASGDPGIGCILLEASGPVFCGGCEDEDAFRAAASAAFSLEKPLIAAVSGPALGAGVVLIALAHVAVAAQGCTFALPEIRGGSFPSGGFELLAEAIGRRRALEVCLTGRVFTLAETVAWGLIHQTAPAFELDDRVSAIAEAFAAADPGAIAEGLRAARRGD
jgi:enoyl-CoA hydratase/carnithine racemase